MRNSNRDWSPILRWVLLVGSLLSSWWTMGSGEMPFSMWLGISAIILAGALGASIVTVGLFLGLFFLRYGLFLLPLGLTIQQPGWVAISMTLLFVFWEATPLWAAGMVGVFTLRRRAFPTWAVGVLAASTHLTLATFLPRPYFFSWGAPLVAHFPGGIWMFGADMLAALALGWVCVIARTVTLGHRSSARTLAVIGSPLVILLLCAGVYESWSGSMIGAQKETHDVIAVQGGLPPFAGGFAVTSDRLLTPVITYSSLHPDLVIFPECIVQAGGQLDKNDDPSKARRHIAAVGLGIASPYSQVLFGVRDWNTNRAYFTDLIDGKPDVTWKDMEFRTPMVDAWPAALSNLPLKYGFRSPDQIAPAERTPDINILIRDELQPRGLRKIGSGMICLSGEIRRPLLVTKARQNPALTVAINPTIGGWLGENEVRGSVVQANARALELGVTLYRVGQRDGTGLFVPWLADSSEEIAQRYGPGSLRFKARLPLYRHATGFTGFFFVFLYLAPLILAGTALLQILNLAQAYTGQSKEVEP